jgi:hypothetical protein
LVATGVPVESWISVRTLSWSLSASAEEDGGTRRAAAQNSPAANAAVRGEKAVGVKSPRRRR